MASPIQANKNDDRMAYPEAFSIAWFVAWRFFVFAEVPRLAASLFDAYHLKEIGGMIFIVSFAVGIAFGLPWTIQKMVDKKYRSFRIVVVDHFSESEYQKTNRLTYAERWRVFWSGFWRTYAIILPLNIVFSGLSHQPLRMDTPLFLLLALLILPFIVQRWFGLDFKSFHLAVVRRPATDVISSADENIRRVHQS